MPTINSIRIVNAQFNKGGGTYDNFMLDPEGNSFVYELENGGGKTVLLLLMLQCVYPNSRLEDNKPFKLMFEGGDRNRTTHAMIEWKLDKGIHNYKYAITGICAKKKTAYDGSEKDEIDYFNYVIFYSHSNEYDIRKIPLCETYEDGSLKSVMSYTDTQSMLKSLEKNKPLHCEVCVFSRKGEYIEFVKKLGIIETEIEIIRKINENENKLDTYFKQYNTSRKLFQDLLIPTTSGCLKDKARIQGMQNPEDKSDNIAESIYQFRDKISALKEWKTRLGDYRQLWDESVKLEHSINSVIGAYQARDAIISEAAAQFRSYESAIQELSSQITDLSTQIESVTEERDGYKISLWFNRLKILESYLNLKGIELENLCKTKEEITQLLKTAEHEWNFARATGKYVQIKERRRKISTLQEQLENTRKSNEELYKSLVQTGAVLHSRYTAHLADLQESYQAKKDEQAYRKAENKKTSEQRGERAGDLKRSQKELAQKEKQLNELRREESNNRKQLSVNFPGFSALFDVEDECKRTKEAIASRTREQEDTEIEIKQLTSEKHNLERKQLEISSQTKSVEVRIGEVSRKLEEYVSKLKNVQEICSTYGTVDIDACDLKIEQESTRLSREIIYLEDRQARLEKRIRFIDEYGYDIIDDSIEEVKAKLKDVFKNVIYGMDHLNQLPEADRIITLQKIPWLPKAMFVSRNDLESIINNPYKLAVSVQDSSVIIASTDLLNPKVICSTGDIFVPHRDATYYANLLSREKAKETIKKEIASVTNKKDSNKKYTDRVRQQAYSVTSFKKEYIDKYQNGYEPELKAQRDVYNTERDELINTCSGFINQIQSIDYKLSNNTSMVTELKKTIKELNDKDRLLDSLYRIIADSSEIESQLNQLKSAIPRYEKEIESLDLRNIEQENKLQQIAESLRQLDKTLDITKGHVTKFNPYAGKSSDAMESIETENLHSKFKAAEETLREKGASVTHLTDEIADNETRIRELTKDIVDVYKIPWDTIEKQDPQSAPSDEYVTSLETRRDNLESQHDLQDKKCRQVEIDYGVQKGTFNKEMEEFQAVSGHAYTRDSGLVDPEEFKNEANTLQKKISFLDSLLLSLESEVRAKNTTKNSYQNEFDMFSRLDGEYGLSKMTVTLTMELKQYSEVNKQIGECNNTLKKARGDFQKACKQLRETALLLKVGTHYSDSFDIKFGDPESLTNANQTAKNIQEYRDGLNGDVQNAEQELTRLEKDETNIVNLILQCNRIYLDYLKGFANTSKIKTQDGANRPMISINLDQCIYDDDLAARKVREYIGKILENKDTTLPTISGMTIPAKLIECAVDISVIKVQILKIDIKGYARQPWDNINA